MSNIYRFLDKVKSWHNFLLIVAGFIVGIFTAGGYFQDFKNSAKRLSERVDKVESRQANIMEKLDTMQQKFNENAIQFTEIRGRIVGIEQNLSFQTRSLDKIESAVSKIADRDRGR